MQNLLIYQKKIKMTLTFIATLQSSCGNNFFQKVKFTWHMRLSKFCGRQTISLQIFKGCLPQSLLSPLFNTLSHMFLVDSIKVFSKVIFNAKKYFWFAKSVLNDIDNSYFSLIRLKEGSIYVQIWKYGEDEITKIDFQNFSRK